MENPFIELPFAALDILITWLEGENAIAERDTVELATSASIDKVRLAAGRAAGIKNLIKQVEQEHERRKRESSRNP